MLGGGDDAVTAATVAERATEAHQRLAAGLGGDSTLHIVQLTYAPKEVPDGPFVLPDRHRSEWWAYYGPDGTLASLTSETRAEADGQLVQTAEYVDGNLVITDTASGDQDVIEGLQSSAADLAARIGAAQIDSSLLIAPDTEVRTLEVSGSQAYVVDMRAGSGARDIRRSYIDKDTYREVKWERLDAGGTVTESRETPVFEVLPGRVPPDS
jgi:hypothetical protein